MTHICIIIHELYQSKASKTKITDLHDISDKNHNDSKLCQKVIIMEV